MWYVCKARFAFFLLTPHPPQQPHLGVNPQVLRQAKRLYLGNIPPNRLDAEVLKIPDDNVSPRRNRVSSSQTIGFLVSSL